MQYFGRIHIDRHIRTQVDFPSAFSGCYTFAHISVTVESFPYQGEVAVDDPRYVAWFDSLPEWSQVYLPEPVRTS